MGSWGGWFCKWAFPQLLHKESLRLQQSYSLLPDFKQIFESFPRPTDAWHDDIREQAYCSYNSGCVNCLWHRFYRNIELTQRRSGIVVRVIVFVEVAVKAFWVSILSAIAVLT